MDRLGFWYVATPYSKYPRGLDAAFEDACKATASLLRMGINVYSPIAHTHPIAKHGGIDPLDHSIWLPADAPMMDAAEGLIVVKMEGWDESYGISEEIKAFRTAGKPIIYVGWE